MGTQNPVDAIALKLAELLLDVLGGNDGLAHGAVDVVAARRALAEVVS